jgi:uncharacterized membrane protein YhiD involved in acid resistance
VNKLETIKQYFTADTIPVDLAGFSIDVFLTFLTSYLIGKIYEKYGRSISNRASFAQNFILLAITTMMVITIIKSSIALSLGLVGALSIVRFRSAIKDPEELVYLFLCMGLGLGFGSGNRNLTLIFFALIAVVLIVRGKFKKYNNHAPMFLMVHSKAGLTIDQITSTIGKNLKRIELHRMENSENTLEAIFSVQVNSMSILNKVNESLRELDKNIEISFTENKGIFN